MTPSAADAEPSLQMSWRKLTVHSATMNRIAEILSRQNEVSSPVIDKTGLTGRFDFILDFFPGVNEDTRPASGSQVTIFEALRDQLGLKLTRTMGTEPILVIGHIEKPTAN